MKKYLLILSALLCSTMAYSQDTPDLSYENRLDIGLKTGLNSTWIVTNNDLPNNDHRNHKLTIKPLGGVSLGYKFTENASLMLEGFYSRQGAKFDLTTANDGKGETIGEKEIKLDYLVVPLLIKYTGTGETRFAFQFGGQIAFLLKGSEVNTYDREFTVADSPLGSNRSFTPGTYTLASTDKSQSAGRFNKKDFNVVADIGMERELSESTYISLGLRMVYGFKDIRTDESISDMNDIDKYTLRYNVTGGLHLGIHWLL
ncbi:MAG TPA: porin family protein [Adhaeribacter sp.]|nr:porin family protein [Adhaeribacter sp.]